MSVLGLLWTTLCRISRN